MVMRIRSRRDDLLNFLVRVDAQRVIEVAFCEVHHNRRWSRASRTLRLFALNAVIFFAMREVAPARGLCVSPGLCNQKGVSLRNS